MRGDWASARPLFRRALAIVGARSYGVHLYTRPEVCWHLGFHFLVEDVHPDEAV